MFSMVDKASDDICLPMCLIHMDGISAAYAGMRTLMLARGMFCQTTTRLTIVVDIPFVLLASVYIC
jgi:hypothetical protein